MSFSDELKNELLEMSSKSATCCKKAFFYGLLLATSRLEDGKITLTLSHPESARIFSELAAGQGAKNLDVKKKTRFGRELFDISLESHSVAEKLRAIRADSSEPLANILGFRCENCAVFYLRGAFISSACISDPKTSYHLEFTVKDAQTAKKFYLLLSTLNCQPKTVSRRSGVGLYFKKSESIEDIIGIMGASHFIFELMNDKLMRELKNDINRRSNCEMGNLSKSVSAARELIAAINRLEDAGLLEALPDDLRETARIRTENPEASLSEMCSMFNPTLSKSGLNHRIQKIKELASKAEGK